ncbi:hypothetical protein 8P_054 [Pseudomonas phage 8P]|nr:hypothetical protein 8P_054 [Pseudomonas phage 8P]
MTPARAEVLLKGQSAQARKVFEVVPILEAWEPLQIKRELERSGKSNMDIRVVCGCLNDLEAAGLVGQPTRDMYRRRVRLAGPKPASKEPVMSSNAAPVTTAARVEPSKPDAGSAIEILGDLSSEITALADEFGKRMRKLAGKVEEAALTIEQERELNAENLGKLRQLQSILKSLS